MELFLAVTIMTLIAGVGRTGLGGLLGSLFRTDSNRLISLLLSATSGVMVSIVCFELMTECLETSEVPHTASSLHPKTHATSTN